MNHSHSLKLYLSSRTLLKNVNHSHSLKIDFQQSHTSEEREPFSFFEARLTAVAHFWRTWTILILCEYDLTAVLQFMTPWEFHTIVSRSVFHRFSFRIGRFTIQVIPHYSMRFCRLLAIVSAVTVLIDIVVHRCERKPRRLLIHLEQTLFFCISML